MHKNTTAYTRSGQAQAPNVATGEVGKAAERRRLIEHWTREVEALPR